MDHLSDEDIAGFYELPARRMTYAAVSNHLLLGCETCQERVRARLLGLEPHLPAESLDLSELLRRSAIRRQEAQRSVIQWANLSRLSQADRLRLLEHGRIKKYGLVVHVLEQVEAAASKRRFENVADHLAFARALIDALSKRVYGAAPIADLLLRHQVTLAHVRRHEQNFAGALAAIEKAEEIRERCCDRLELARFRRVQAAVLFDLGEFEQAAKMAHAATDLYRGAHDSFSVGRSLLQEASILAFCDSPAGLAKAQEGLPLLVNADAN